ncbi:hypothetical protein INT47_009239 [Mucor saturninus]|uniref:Uncharacterized protein n=1 Tax=Mucor saturninus TaxID=64648 RepID=A0A8H7UVW6_9FUNG|nr:hypothetical protein INT47_009239 [Mucor saturninus]
MHNLFLGTAKRMMEKWILCGHLDDNDLCEMQVEANTITLPSEYASLTTKIAKGFPFMKADEWKSWCLIYSPVVLKGRLEDDLFANWIEFVDACRLLTKPTITEEEIELAHGSLERFCGGCEELYEHDVLSPNMHLHLHLKETINDFGPIYGYWLFSFERYNGLVKGFNTNRKAGFEKTYMNKFVQSGSKGDFYQAHLATITSPSHLALFNRLSPATVFVPQQNRLSIFSLPAFLESAMNPTKQTFGNEPLPPSALPLVLKAPTTMRKLEYDCLLKYYKMEYADDDLCSAKNMIRNAHFVNDRIQKFTSINLLGQVYKGSEGANGRGSYIQAMYIEKNGDSGEIYAGRIKYLFVHNFSPTPTPANFLARLNPQHVFAFVEWYEIPYHQPRINQGIELYKPTFQKYNYDNILPVHRILSPIAIGNQASGRGAAKVLVIPLPRKLYA